MNDFFPASGSFFIPLILIVFLYFKIFTTQQKVASRRKQIKTNTSGSQGQGQGTKQVDWNNVVRFSVWMGGGVFTFLSDSPCFVCIMAWYWVRKVRINKWELRCWCWLPWYLTLAAGVSYRKFVITSISWYVHIYEWYILAILSISVLVLDCYCKSSFSKKNIKT